MAVAVQRLRMAVSRRRNVGVGIFFLAMALAIWAFFLRGAESGLTTTFGLNPARATVAIKLPDLVLPTEASLWFLVAVCAFLGGWQLAKGFKSTGWALGVVAFALFVAASQLVRLPLVLYGTRAGFIESAAWTGFWLIITVDLWRTIKKYPQT